MQKAAMSQSPEKSKNKDVNQFQNDVKYNIGLPSVLKQSYKNQRKDKNLQLKLESNLINPNNKWQPKDHSIKFMRHLRNYSSGDLPSMDNNGGQTKSQGLPYQAFGSVA